MNFNITNLYGCILYLLPTLIHAYDATHKSKKGIVQLKIHPNHQLGNLNSKSKTSTSPLTSQEIATLFKGYSQNSNTSTSSRKHQKQSKDSSQ